MSSVEIHPSLMRALHTHARRERTTVDVLVKRLIADALQKLDDYDAVKAFAWAMRLVAAAEKTLKTDPPVAHVYRH